MPETGLVRLDRARLALIEAKSVDEVKDIRDQAEAIRLYLRAQGAGLEMQNDAAEIKLRAERKLGEMLGEMEKNKGAATPLHDERALPKLHDLGIQEVQSHRWQQEARISEPEFETWIAEKRADKGELTSAGLRNLGMRLGRDGAEIAALPDGIFDVILADPPWPYPNQFESWGPTSLHYRDLPLESIAALPIQDSVAENAALFLWVTNSFLREAFLIVDAWGFEYKTNMVWVKRNLTRPGTGFYVRGRHELLFICTKGSMAPKQTGQTPIGSVIEADVREHSRKPDEVYEIIERMYPEGEYLELFARGHRDNWTAWGTDSETLLAKSDAHG